MKSFDEVWVPNLIMGQGKSLFIYNELLSVENVPGALAEVGVYKGSTASLIHSVFPERDLYLYDTFEGIRGSIKGIDKHRDGDFSDTSLEEVKKLVGTDVHYRVGIFPSTFQEAEINFAFVHSDTDTYMGTLASLVAFVPRLAINGKILFDDYEWKDCPGVKQAIEKWSLNNTIKFKTHKYGNQLLMQKIE